MLPPWQIGKLRVPLQSRQCSSLQIWSWDRVPDDIMKRFIGVLCLNPYSTSSTDHHRSNVRTMAQAFSQHLGATFHALDGPFVRNHSSAVVCFLYSLPCFVNNYNKHFFACSLKLWVVVGVGILWQVIGMFMVPLHSLLHIHIQSPKATITQILTSKGDLLDSDPLTCLNENCSSISSLQKGHATFPLEGKPAMLQIL